MHISFGQDERPAWVNWHEGLNAKYHRPKFHPQAKYADLRFPSCPAAACRNSPSRSSAESREVRIWAKSVCIFYSHSAIRLWYGLLSVGRYIGKVDSRGKYFSSCANVWQISNIYICGEQRINALCVPLRARLRHTNTIYLYTLSALSKRSRQRK
jgi:hypothetical protein